MIAPSRHEPLIACNRTWTASVNYRMSIGDFVTDLVRRLPQLDDDYDSSDELIDAIEALTDRGAEAIL